MHAHGVWLKIIKQIVNWTVQFKKIDNLKIDNSNIDNSKIDDFTVIDNQLIFDNSNPQSKIQKLVIQNLTTIRIIKRFYFQNFQRASLT